ncbi:aqualysin-1-like [Lytechinus variegatus]|uniref:aqualysin-1-like n=1 Tax=Lytechinus variegatus TaxID=7654 RepID=UPI001BB257C4|nr:aqualysin-1-like [Lytechinus variegatus]
MKCQVLVLVLILGLTVEARPKHWDKLFKKSEDDRVPGQYIVSLKPGFDAGAFVSRVETAKSASFVNCSFSHVYNIINGFAAKLTFEGLEELLSSDEVSLIEENGIVRAHKVGSWGIDRVDQRYLPLDGEAEFTGDGDGVTVYILDTGIYPGNEYFDGRATVGYDAIGGGQEGVDCNGHGTHCAGTIGSNDYGIARKAELVGVRVLNCLGSGLTSQIVNGLDWVQKNAKKPAVASMSLGGGVSPLLDEAVSSLIESGVLVTVSAGNDDHDACRNSPARVEETVTVGATDRSDIRAYFSNYGTCLDIFAPGVDITSTWYTEPTAINTISGTSMACPHVAGAAAIALGNDNGLTPSALKSKILADATTGVVNDPQPGSPNLLLYIP